MLSLSEFLKAMELILKALIKPSEAEHNDSLLDGNNNPPPPYTPHTQRPNANPAGNVVRSGKSSKRAIAEWDYTKSEDNEVDFLEGQYITDIEEVDNNWWMGRNEKEEIGLFPSSYVKLVKEDDTTLPIQAQQNVLPAAPTTESVPQTSIPEADRQPSSTRKTDTDLICSLCCRNIRDYAFSCSACENGEFDICKPCHQLGRACPGRHTLQCVKIEIEYRVEEDIRNMNLNKKSNPTRNDLSDGLNGRKEEDKQLKDTLIAAIVSKKPNVKWEDIAGESAV